MYRSRPFLERFVDHSRNFGHHAAMQAGLAHARGELIFLIDCDREVAPASLGDFHAKLTASGADLVYGYQEAHKGAWCERASGLFFWGGLNRLSSVPITRDLREGRCKLAFGDALLGFTSLAALMAMTLGVLTTGLGLIGIYLGKVFEQVQNRLNCIVRDIHR